MSSQYQAISQHDDEVPLAYSQSQSQLFSMESPSKNRQPLSTSTTTTTKTQAAQAKANKDFWTATLYGTISSLMVIPVSISFCSIIFRDTIFHDHLPQLVKLVLFSSAIHQLCFAYFSSLSFAVGQVQDAGLIFLSAMASDIAYKLIGNRDENDNVTLEETESVLSTTLFVLAISTAILGVLLIIVSKLKLASLVQYLPMPVIGGYLAFIGFYCGLAGLTMMAGTSTLIEAFTYGSGERVKLMLPGLVIGITMYLVLRQVRSPFVLPISLAVILIGFYTVMFITGTSFEDAREQGWIAPLAPMGKSQSVFSNIS